MPVLMIKKKERLDFSNGNKSMFVYDDKWGKRVPRVELYHELRHSYDADRGTVTDKTISNGISIMEIRAINAENKIRIKTGDVKRNNYDKVKIPEEYLD